MLSTESATRLLKTKVDSWFSVYLDINYGVPQESIVRPLLFNKDLCDLLFEDYSSDFVNFADNTAPYKCGYLHLMKTVITLKQLLKKYLNGSVLPT